MDGKIDMKSLSKRVAEEIKKQRDNGLPIRTADEKGVVDLMPDGRKIYITNDPEQKESE